MRRIKRKKKALISKEEVRKAISTYVEEVERAGRLTPKTLEGLSRMTAEVLRMKLEKESFICTDRVVTDNARKILGMIIRSNPEIFYKPANEQIAWIRKNRRLFIK